MQIGEQCCLFVLGRLVWKLGHGSMKNFPRCSPQLGPEIISTPTQSGSLCAYFSVSFPIFPAIEPPFKTVLSTTTGCIGALVNAWRPVCCRVKRRLMSDINPMVARNRIMKRRFAMAAVLGLSMGHRSQVSRNEEACRRPAKKR